MSCLSDKSFSEWSVNGHIEDLLKVFLREDRANLRRMKMSKVGNQTNSQDPQAVNSRVFVGNLNTFHCAKSDVERMFQRYGRLAGISMHKGYAFVQFTNPFDARGACMGEDGRRVLGQTLDVNMVAEPKAHQTGRKRQNVAKTGNDWDYYYDSYYASTLNPRLVPPVKRPRLAGTRHKKNSRQQQQLICAQIKTYRNPDILICGNCREMFNALQDLLDHKKEYCKLRFTCKCNLFNDQVKDGEEAALVCVQCKEAFYNAWDLMVHVQAQHLLNIYELGGTGNNHHSVTAEQAINNHHLEQIQNHNHSNSHQQRQQLPLIEERQLMQQEDNRERAQVGRRLRLRPHEEDEEDNLDDEEDMEEDIEEEDEDEEDEVRAAPLAGNVSSPAAALPREELASHLTQQEGGMKPQEHQHLPSHDNHSHHPPPEQEREEEEEEWAGGEQSGHGLLDSNIMGALNIEPISCEAHRIISNGDMAASAVHQATDPLH